MIGVSIAEDLPEIRSILEKIIKAEHDMLLLSSSPNAEDAMPLIIEAQPDIVMMDINMPGINGIDCIRTIKNDCPGTQFMIFTIYENDEKIFDALAAGASGYLLKKTSPEKIIEAIKELYHGGSPMSTPIARKVINHFKEVKNQGMIVLPIKKMKSLTCCRKVFCIKKLLQNFPSLLAQ